MKFSIYTTSTTGYERSLETQARRIVASLSLEKRINDEDILILIVTDKDETVQAARTVYVNGLPGATVKVLADPRLAGGFENYGQNAQLLIAQMRTMATMQALAWNSDRCLSLDGDVLPPHNAIRCMLDMLEFDAGYYGVSFCPYPSHGGGAFLGGRGTHRNPILPDFYEDEKDIPEELLAEREELLKDVKSNEVRLKEIDTAIKQIPPKGDVFAMNAAGKWKRRGWFDNAYPAVGKGAVVPVEWTGCGCTMMNREALALCDWAGYDGRGTEDLYLNFQRWEPNGIKMCCIPHCPCDHVVRNPDPAKSMGEFIHVHTGHEREGEYSGHLRQWRGPWYAHQPGEQKVEIELRAESEA